MKLRVKFRLALLAAGFFAGVALLTFLLQPLIAQMGMTSLLHDAGFTQAHIGKTERVPGGFAFLETSLDRNGFSTIGSISLQSGTLTIDKLVLTGEWPAMKMPDIAGWTRQSSLTGLLTNIAGKKIQTLTLTGGQLDATLPGVGLVRLEAKGIATLLPDQAVRLQSTVWTVQQKLKAQMTVNGEFAANGIASLDVEINDGKIDIPDITASRMGGWIILNRDKETNPWSISSQIMAGTASLYGVDLHGLTFSLQGNTLESAIALQAGGSDNTATPLAMDMTLRRNGEDSVSATFRAESLGDKKPGAVFVYDSRAQTFDGLLAAGNIGVADLGGNVWMKGKLRQATTGTEIDVQDVRLQALADAVGLIDLTIDGSMTGLLPITRDPQGKFRIEQGLLRSTTTGRMSLSAEDLPAGITATRNDADAILKAFQYEKIETLVSGDVFGKLSGDISLTGKSATDKTAKTTLLTLHFN